VVVFHHDDNDGKLAAQLIYESKSNNINLISCNYSSNMPDSSMVNMNDIVFIVDYCIPIEQLTPITETAKFVVFMDHHKTAIDMVDSNFDYFNELVKKGSMMIDVDMARCGAKITYDHFQKNKDWNEETVKLIDIYDRWTGEDIRADYLNQFIFNSAKSYVGSDIWNRLLHEDGYLEKACEIGKKFYELNLVKNEIIYSSFSKETEFHNLKIGVIEGYGNSQLFGKHIEDYDACCVYHRTNNGKWQYSLYSDKPEAELNRIAESYGGGGHKKAAGFTIEDKLF
jgi:oligoribonuclease NrnB/cAMP/cGMP phosphodiesterase (DHH superfamily)